MKTSDFDYYLPEELIAQTPLKDRSSSRLMVVERSKGNIIEDHFYNIKDYLPKNSILVINNTKVVPARIYGIDAGILAIYRTADLVIFDPNMIQTYEKSQSKSFNTPLKSREITGVVVGTVCDGRFVFNKMTERRFT